VGNVAREGVQNMHRCSGAINDATDVVPATILYVKLLHLWRRMSYQAYVQLVKVC